jgi:hypothetical protein
VERIEQLEQHHRDIKAGFRTHYADRSPKKLEEEQRQLLAQFRAGERRTLDEMPDEILLQFPGFSNYRKPVS